MSFWLSKMDSIFSSFVGIIEICYNNIEVYIEINTSKHIYNIKIIIILVIFILVCLNTVLIDILSHFSIHFHFLFLLGLQLPLKLFLDHIRITSTHILHNLR